MPFDHPGVQRLAKHEGAPIISSGKRAILPVQKDSAPRPGKNHSWREYALAKQIRGLFDQFTGVVMINSPMLHRPLPGNWPMEYSLE